MGTAPQAELAPGDGGDGSATAQQAQEDHALAALSLELQTMMLETVAEPHSRSSSQQQQQVCTPSTPSAAGTTRHRDRACHALGVTLPFSSTVNTPD